MYTLILICCFAGFFQLYNTSAKAKLSNAGTYQRWLQAHAGFTKIAGCFLIILSYILLVVKDGVAIGSFAFFLMLMAVACLIISLCPLHYLKIKHITLIVLMSFFMELIFFS